MIISLTFRHGTEEKLSRDTAKKALSELSELSPRITRAQLVFSKETQHTHHEDLITCHLSIHLPNHESIEVYDRRPSEIEALDQAISCAKRRLLQTISKTTKLNSKTNLFEALENVS